LRFTRVITPAPTPPAADAYMLIEVFDQVMGSNVGSLRPLQADLMLIIFVAYPAGQLRPRGRSRIHISMSR